MGGYVCEETNDRADEAYEAARQEEVDAEQDRIESRRRTSGFSPEQLSIQDAFMEGQRAGTSRTAAGCNPYQDPLCPEYQAWERGRSAVEGARSNRRAA